MIYKIVKYRLQISQKKIWKLGLLFNVFIYSIITKANNILWIDRVIKLHFQGKGFKMQRPPEKKLKSLSLVV